MGSAVFVVVCAMTSTLSIVVPDWVVITSAPRIGWSYSPMMWSLLTIWAAAGVVMMRPQITQPAAMIAAVTAAQVATNGMTAIQAFFANSGLGGLAKPHLVTMVTYAVLVVVAAATSIAAVVGLLWREPVGWRDMVPARPGYVIAGAAVVMFLPSVRHLLPDNPWGWSFTYLMGWAFALPWGFGLAAAGWLRGRVALAAVVTVAASVALCTAYSVGTEVFNYLFPPPPD